MSVASKRPRTAYKQPKRVYHGVDDLMKDDGNEDEDEEETAVIERSNNEEEEEEEEEDPFVDNLITQLEDLRNKVRRKRCTKI